MDCRLQPSWTLSHTRAIMVSQWSSLFGFTSSPFWFFPIWEPEKMLFWWYRCILFPLNSQQLWRWYILFWKNAECKELLRNRWRENNPLLCIIDYLWFFPPSCYISILSEKRKRDQVWMIVLSFLLEREREREKDRKTARIDRLIIPERGLREREIEIFFLVSFCLCSRTGEEESSFQLNASWRGCQSGTRTDTHIV